MKRDGQLYLFRRLEQFSKKLVSCETSIEFLQLCQNLGLTPTFAKVDQEKSKKWSRSTKDFERNIVAEELKTKVKLLTNLREDINSIYTEIRSQCPLFRYLAILRTITKLRCSQYETEMNGHSKKISKLMYNGKNVDEHITNISSYRLSFFQKLALSRGLQFAYPQRVSSREIQANFEKAYWKLESKIESNETKELTAATLKCIALNYIERKGPFPPRALKRTLGQLKKRDDIIITKPDKGSGVVVMDKSEYVSLLCKASVNDITKFIPISPEQPRTRGRPMTHYHPLLKKEKDMNATVHRILAKEIAKSVCQSGSRLAHLYGLPKTHKETLSMRPILSATGTYNYKLTQWLDEKLKPLSQNKYTIDNVFSFASDIRSTDINVDDILVSYDVSSLFTNVPLDETIQIIADKAFTDNWFNVTYGLNLSKPDLITLLNIATKDQLFQFQSNLYEQIDGVAMGSPLGPLMANAFMCNIEECLESSNQMPKYYKRYVDDTLVFMPNTESAMQFLDLLNKIHPAINFTMETADREQILFGLSPIPYPGNS
ncbi:uncharacterized protein LOC117122019 [Anneissia japonica]|uniref:uncharacterized protein LOC117122019 n=1 Tax=Anneissia japonica TaxID=1529436 RepID=UPI00142552C2|nr:uncharacterized protein LOC117122019 [Anneissia japonica]